MKIAVIPNLIREEAKACAQEARKLLEDLGCETAWKPYDCQGVSDCWRGDPLLAGCDLLFAIGGDGTIIHTAKLAAALDKPVLGINAGKLGFTASLEREELPLLANLAAGRYREESRLMLQAEVASPRGRSVHHALNDAVVSAELAKIIDYHLALAQGQSMEKGTGYPYRADGFIVSTPTGSTAYSLSAGGPVVDPALDCLLYTPICPHSLFNRSVLFGGNTRLEVDIPENRSRIYLTVDGENPIELQPGDRLVFSRSPWTARFIKLTDRNFYDILNEKLVY